MAPEISLAEAAELPDTPATTRPASPGTPLRVTARLVDIGVVAYDKKGHPVTNLKPKDFEIFDNGRKQEVRFFSRAGGAPEEDSAKTPDPAPNRTTLSNRLAAADTKPEIGGTEGNTTILLIDSSNLAWADLTHARGEILRFLQALPAYRERGPLRGEGEWLASLGRGDGRSRHVGGKVEPVDAQRKRSGSGAGGGTAATGSSSMRFFTRKTCNT